MADVIALTETWQTLDDGEADILETLDTLKQPGWICIHEARQTPKKGGGTALLIRNELGDITRIKVDGTTAVESTWATISTPWMKMLVGCIYNPPGPGFQERCAQIPEITRRAIELSSPT